MALWRFLCGQECVRRVKVKAVAHQVAVVHRAVVVIAEVDVDAAEVADGVVCLPCRAFGNIPSCLLPLLLLPGRGEVLTFPPSPAAQQHWPRFGVGRVDGVLQAAALVVGVLTAGALHTVALPLAPDKDED